MNIEKNDPIVIGRCAACGREIVSGNVFWMQYREETLLCKDRDCFRRYMIQEIENDNFDIQQYLRGVGFVELEPSREELQANLEE